PWTSRSPTPRPRTGGRPRATCRCASPTRRAPWTRPRGRRSWPRWPRPPRPTRTGTARSPSPPARGPPSRPPEGLLSVAHLLDGPGVAVRVGEVDEGAPRELHDVGGLHALGAQGVAHRGGAVDHDLHPLHRARGRVREPGAD